MKKWRGVKPCSILIHQLRPFRLVYNISMALCTPYMMHLLASVLSDKRQAVRNLRTASMVACLCWDKPVSADWFSE